MKIQFPYITLILGIIGCLLIYILSLAGRVVPGNELYVRFFLLGIFVISTLIIILSEMRKLKLFSKSANFLQTFLILTLSTLLISTIFQSEAGAFATGIFIGAAFLFLLSNKKVYKLNATYYFLFLYAALMIFGTFGTPRGFRFPDTTLSFILLPLAYCCFSLSKEVLLQIARVFFRAMMVYMMLSIIYWVFNILYLDVNFTEWITNKLSFEQSSMVGWNEQIRLSGGTTFAAFYFVTSWAYYYHPSYISLVLFFGLIIGLYLYYKRDVYNLVTKKELILYIILCFIVIALMESRVGIVGLILILITTGLYYSKLSTNHFKVILLFCFISACVILFLFDETFGNFLDDNTRKIDYTLAINYIKDHFWWGAGFSEQKAALEYQEIIMKDVLPSANNVKTYTHNQFLGNMVQFGIWGLLVLLAILSAVMRYAVKSRNYLLQMFLLIIILFMMIEEPLYGQKGFTIFSVFLTFFIAIGESNDTKKAIWEFQKK